MPSTQPQIGDPLHRWSEYRHQRRVQFHEVDGYGIVHFSCFFRYMQETEQAMWRAAGLSIAPPGSDIGFPRVAVACKYHRPLRFEDEFDICIRVAEMTTKTIRYTCLLSRLDEPVATGTMTTVCVRKQPDGSLEAIPIPPHIAARFEVAADGPPGADA